MEEVSTAAIESFNLLIRMSNGRYMRSSNRFSRKIENQRVSALALYFALPSIINAGSVRRFG